MRDLSSHWQVFCKSIGQLLQSKRYIVIVTQQIPVRHQLSEVKGGLLCLCLDTIEFKHCRWIYHLCLWPLKVHSRYDSCDASHRGIFTSSAADNQTGPWNLCTKSYMTSQLNLRSDKQPYPVYTLISYSMGDAMSTERPLYWSRMSWTSNARKPFSNCIGHVPQPGHII